MDARVFLLIGLVQLVAVAIGVRHTAGHRSSYALLLLVVVGGLAYDNLVVAAGGVLGESTLLRSLNAGRFWIHALATPTLAIVAFGLLRLVGVGRAGSRAWHTAVCLLATALIALGVWIDVVNLTLAPALEGGVLRYVNTDELLPGPPIAAVTTILAVTVCGAAYWRATGWPWLFAASVIMFGTAGAVGQVLVQNVGEAVFAAGLVATLAHTATVASTVSGDRHADSRIVERANPSPP